MSATSWAGFIVSIITIIGGCAAAVRFLVKHYFTEMKAELKPNGGGSIKDQVTRLETRVNEADQLRREMDKKLDKMYNILIDYISKN